MECNVDLQVVHENLVPVKNSRFHVRCRDAEDNFYDRTEGVGQRHKRAAQPEALDAATLLGQKVRSVFLLLDLCCGMLCRGRLCVLCCVVL